MMDVTLISTLQLFSQLNYHMLRLANSWQLCNENLLLMLYYRVLMLLLMPEDDLHHTMCLHYPSCNLCFLCSWYSEVMASVCHLLMVHSSSVQSPQVSVSMDYIIWHIEYIALVHMMLSSCAPVASSFGKTSCCRAANDSDISLLHKWCMKQEVILVLTKSTFD